MRSPARPDFGLVRVLVHDVLEMVVQGFIIWLVDSLEDVENDACKTLGVEIDFLVVGNLADLTER